MSKTEEMAPPVPPRDVADPPRIDERYRIEKEIGHGGMGRVFVAHDRKLGRDVAIKVLASGLHGEEALRRFEQEARATCALNHGNILDVHDIGMHEGSPYIVSELLHGVTLRERLRGGPLPLKEASGFALQLAQGLSAAHEKGIVHRDLKPENLFITDAGRLKILDFGIAKLVAPMTLGTGETVPSPRPHTVEGAILGTVGYMSPEQVRGQPADQRSDVFNFGAIVYEMLAGRSPFERDTAVETGYAILNDDPPPLPAAVPANLRRLVQRCLAKRPEDRFESAHDLVDALASAAGERVPVQRRGNYRWVVRAGAALALVVLAVLGWRDYRFRQARSQLDEAVRLADAGKLAEAFALALEVDKVIPAEPALTRLWPEVSRLIDVETNPGGAVVQARLYGADDSSWRTLGVTPVSGARIPVLPSQVRLTKPGYVTAERGQWRYNPYRVKLAADLYREGDVPPGMVAVPGGDMPWLPLVGLENVAPGDVPEAFVDKYEVTNGAYRKFIEEGGYRKRDYWKEPFVEGGRTLSWEEAMRRFRDRTGRPGPATWQSGDYPEGQQDHPVTGVSWYEAAAYAVRAGKSLPTVYHWAKAATTWATPEVVPRSNFGGTGLMRVGSSGGVSGYGLYDMAGNAKEWCWNSVGDRRYILGGAFNEPIYMFNDADAQKPFAREATFGFRLARYPKPVRQELLAPLQHEMRDYSKEHPVDDAAFRIYAGLYGYDKAALDSRVELVTDADRWRIERIGFAAAYRGERMSALVYTPKNVPPPWQVVIYFPGSGALHARSSADLSTAAFSYVVKSGRALVYPIYKSTYERGDGLASDNQDNTRNYRDHVLMWAQDLSRALDYVETRKDLDSKRIAFLGASWGGALGPLLAAVEPRIRAVVLISGGLEFQATLPEVDPFNFAPRARQPTLLLNGRYDFFFPVETSQLPLFRLLGAPAQDKRQVITEGGHAPPQDLVVKETIDWLDRYLGPVR